MLLLEEFINTTSFAQWFLKSIDFQEALGGRVIKVERSATQSIGESDLEVTIRNSRSHLCRILIENKIKAGFQPRQAERYQERGESYVRRGICKLYRTVLVASQQYLGSAENKRGFDAVLNLEKVVDWFNQSRSITPRIAFKIYLLSRAVEKSVHGWQLIEDGPVSMFWKRYWELVWENAPELELPEPTPKPATSSFIYFKPPELRPNIVLVHKVDHGNIDLQFSKMGNRTSEMKKRFESHLKDNMQITKAGKSAVIRIKVPRIEMTNDLDKIEGDIIEGIRAAQYLLNWYLSLPDSSSSSFFGQP